ncbi:MAG: hypothetical protein K0U74_11710 [Alphaproteobacteria bacterium]|nr:hypothetical protein [Alphaproteobacteria bacterium]
MSRSNQNSILPGWMMTMPGALITGLVLAFLIRQMFMFTGAVADMTLPADRAPDCYTTSQKLSVGKNISDSYRARQMQMKRRGLYKRYKALMEVGSLCQAGQCSSKDLRAYHRKFRSYVRSRALDFKYAEDYFGRSGRPFFRKMYETREEDLIRDVAVRLHRKGLLDLRRMDGYGTAARMFMYAPPDKFIHCR